jgi:hypothetical protein
MSLFSKLFGGQPKEPEPKKEWVYIGKIEDIVTITNEGKKSHDLKFYFLFYMTNQGDRRYRVLPQGNVTIEYYLRERTPKILLDAETWVAGGEFPEGLGAEVDTLGEMLNRLIDAKLTGKKHDD